MQFRTALHIMAPGIVAAMAQIIDIALIGIGLPLKRDVTVGIPAHGQPDEPLHEISNIEEYKQHLALLGRVDAFMIHQLAAQVHPMVDKQYPQQVNRRESMER